MLSKSFQSCTPSPYGYSPCLGESADDYVECIHCISLWLLAKVADFGFWQSRPPSAGDLKVGGADCTVPRTGGRA